MERDNSAMQFGLNILMCLPALSFTSRAEVRTVKMQLKIKWKINKEKKPALILIKTTMEVMFPPASVCWLFGSSAGLHKKRWANFHTTWMEDLSRPRMDPVNFWCRSRERDGSMTFFHCPHVKFYESISKLNGSYFCPLLAERGTETRHSRMCIKSHPLHCHGKSDWSPS